MRKCDEAITTINKHCAVLFDKARRFESGHDQLNIDVTSMKSELSKTEISINGFRELINSSSQWLQSLYKNLLDHFNQVDATSTWTSDECIKKHWEFEKELEEVQSELVSLTLQNSTLRRDARTLKGRSLSHN
jgi:hypothetical protein